MRAQGASWSSCARSNGVTEDLLRRACDSGYVPPDLKSAAERTPALASGRENRPSAYEPAPSLPRPAIAPSIVPKAAAVASIPTADQVARALVAAARVLGEDARHLFDAELPRVRRFRFCAFIALRAGFPCCPVAALGRMTGILTNHKVQIDKARQTNWWPLIGDQAIEAAMAALEG